MYYSLAWISASRVFLRDETDRLSWLRGFSTSLDAAESRWKLKWAWDPRLNRLLSISSSLAHTASRHGKAVKAIFGRIIKLLYVCPVITYGLRSWAQKVPRCQGTIRLASILALHPLRSTVYPHALPPALLGAWDMSTVDENCKRTVTDSSQFSPTLMRVMAWGDRFQREPKAAGGHNLLQWPVSLCSYHDRFCLQVNCDKLWKST